MQWAYEAAQISVIKNHDRCQSCQRDVRGWKTVGMNVVFHAPESGVETKANFLFVVCPMCEPVVRKRILCLKSITGKNIQSMSPIPRQTVRFLDAETDVVRKGEILPVFRCAVFKHLEDLRDIIRRTGHVFITCNGRDVLMIPFSSLIEDDAGWVMNQLQPFICYEWEQGQWIQN